jgi:hypothetical protein
VNVCHFASASPLGCTGVVLSSVTDVCLKQPAEGKAQLTNEPRDDKVDREAAVVSPFVRLQLQ